MRVRDKKKNLVKRLRNLRIHPDETSRNKVITTKLGEKNLTEIAMKSLTEEGRKSDNEDKRKR